MSNESRCDEMVYNKVFFFKLKYVFTHPKNMRPNIFFSTLDNVIKFLACLTTTYLLENLLKITPFSQFYHIVCIYTQDNSFSFCSIKTNKNLINYLINLIWFAKGSVVDFILMSHLSKF